MKTPQDDILYALGKVEFFVYYPTQKTNAQAAIDQANSRINNQSVLLLEGDIHTKDGKILPILAPHCQIAWIDAVRKDEMI